MSLIPTDPFHRLLGRVEVQRPAQDLVENRVTFGAEDAEFAIYDTFSPAEQVPLRASNPLFCGMVTGAKRVHTAAGEAIEFLPSESLVVPSNQTIHIDFPGASEQRPTKCLTIEIDRSKVARVVESLNETAPRPRDSLGGGEWVYTDATVCHFQNPPGVERTIRALAGLFIEDHPDKQLLIDLEVQELVVRMLRMEARGLLIEASQPHSTGDPLAAAVEYAKHHLHEPLTVADLASVAYMSESTFYRYFRNAFGQTPLAFLTEQRIRRAARLLVATTRAGMRSVSDVAADVGFASTSHFIRVFQRHTGETPKQFQLQRKRAAAAKA